MNEWIRNFNYLTLNYRPFPALPHLPFLSNYLSEKEMFNMVRFMQMQDMSLGVSNQGGRENVRSP